MLGIAPRNRFSQREAGTEARQRTVQVAAAFQRLADAIVRDREIALPGRVFPITTDQRFRDGETAPVALERQRMLPLFQQHVADAVMHDRNVPLPGRIVRLTLRQNRRVALRGLVGGERRLALALGSQHVAQHRAGAVADGFAAAFAGKLHQAPERFLSSFEPARTQAEHAEQHLRLGIVGSQVSGPGIGSQRVTRVVDQRQRAQLPPAGRLAAVELAVGVHQALPKHVLGLAMAAARFDEHGFRGRLDVRLEGLAGSHGGSTVHAIGKRCLWFREA